METKIPIYKQRGQVIVIKDRWWRYRIITISAFVVLYLFLASVFAYDSLRFRQYVFGSSIHDYFYFSSDSSFVGKPLAALLFIACGLVLAIIETKRVFSRKKK